MTLDLLLKIAWAAVIVFGFLKWDQLDSEMIERKYFGQDD